MLHRLTALCLAAALTGCASTYRGPAPDFSLRGEAAQEEVRKFSLRESYWDQPAYAYYMGPRQELYTLKSLRPIIEQTSPEAIESLAKADQWNRLSLIALGAAVAMLLVEFTDDDFRFSNEQAWAYYSLIGFSIGTGFVRPHFMKQGAERFNRDLRGKFGQPSVAGLGFSFTY